MIANAIISFARKRRITVEKLREFYRAVANTNTMKIVKDVINYVARDLSTIERITVKTLAINTTLVTEEIRKLREEPTIIELRIRAAKTRIGRY